MKKTITTAPVAAALLGAALLAVVALLSFPSAAHAACYDGITASELNQKIHAESDDAFIVLDVREPDSYEQGHIPGAISIPLTELGYRCYWLDRSKDIIVYCDRGVTSEIACRVLINAGFKDVYNLTGGLEAWQYAIATGDGRVSI